MREVRLLALVAVGTVLVLTAAARVHVWGDEHRLWREAVRVSPTKPRPWINLGREYALIGADALAAAAYRTAANVASAPGRSPIERAEAQAVAARNVAALEGPAWDDWRF